jgi:hypothetical protein
VALADQIRCSHDAAECSPAHLTHDRITVDVVLDHAHRLFEGPCLAALPLEVIAGETLTQYLPWLGLEEMPCATVP